MYTEDELEGGTAEQLSASLGKASSQLQQCVSSCKHIAKTARQQNNFKKVRSTFLYLLLFSGFNINDNLSFNPYRRMKSGSWSPR